MPTPADPPGDHPVSTEVVDVQTIAKITTPKDPKSQTSSYQFSGARHFIQPGDEDF